MSFEELDEPCSKIELDKYEDEHRQAVDRTVGGQMYDLAEKLRPVSLGEIISECHKAAIDATLQTKPELAALFIRLGAELTCTKQDGIVGCAVTRPSKAIKQIAAMAADTSIETELNHSAKLFQLQNKQPSTGKKCGTCWHLFKEPFVDHEGNLFTGCGNDRRMCIGHHPVTGQDLFREIINTDDACEDYLTEEEGENDERNSTTVWLLSQAKK